MLARLAGSHEVEVHTLLAGGVHPAEGFALACQLDKGLSRQTDYMALRREEDLAAASILGVRSFHHQLCEAPNRGYHDAASLFGEAVPNDPLTSQLAHMLPEIVEGADLVLAPFCHGNHIDHVLVRAAAEKTCADRLLLWRDLPYAVRCPDPSSEWVSVRVSDHLGVKIDACLAYASQIGFQFGSPEAARQAILRDTQRIGGELVLPCSDAARAALGALAPPVTKQSQAQPVS
nr:hypothetical protein [Parvularcula maris]